MDKINASCMKLSCLALAIGIYAAIGLLAGIVTFLVAWIFMLAMEVMDE